MRELTPLLDKITLKDGRTLTGIMDFVSTKQIYILDFTNNEEVDYLLLAMLWKGNKPEMRFSVYCSIYYPSLKLPKAILIPKNNISETSRQIDTTKISKVKKRTIKFST